MPRNPYVQVALTYLRRPLASALTGIFVLSSIGIYAYCVCGLLRFDSTHSWLRSPDADADTLMMPLVASTWLAGLLAMHFKDQFTESRSRLTPYFHGVHLTVAATVTFALAVAAPLLVVWLADIRSVGLAALTATLVGMVFWLVLMSSTWVPWLVVLQMLLSSWSETTRHVTAMIISGQFEAQAVGLLALGIAIIVLAGVRLCRLNEDMPEYHRRMPTNWTTKGRMTGQNINYDGPWPRMLTDWFRHQAMLHLTRQARRAERSPWSRICRWQLGMATGWRLWIWAIFPIGFLQFMQFYLPHRSPTGAPVMFVANSLVFLPTMLVPGQALGWLMWHTRVMPHELMLPVNRRAYVQQFVMALALGYFQLWGVLCIATLLWWLVAVAPSAPLTYLGAVAMAGLLVQIALFGVITLVWSVTSSRAVQVAAFMICVFASTLCVFRRCDDFHFQLQSGTLPLALCAAALGVLFSYIAYRRWLAADFD